MVAVIGFALTLVCCSQVLPSQTSTTPTANSSPVKAFSTQEPTITSTPLMASSANLGPVPQNCPPGQTPQNISPYFAPAIGGSIIWAVMPSTVHLKGTSYDQDGWYWKILWAVKANYTGLVQIKGENLRNGTPLYFDFHEGLTVSLC